MDGRLSVRHIVVIELRESNMDELLFANTCQYETFIRGNFFRPSMTP